MLFWGEGFTRKFMRFLFLVLVVLFCWGWVAHVALGGMTTGQYIQKLRMDFQQGIKNGSEKICEYTGRIARNVDVLYNDAGKSVQREA